MKVITKMELQPGMILGEDIVNHGKVIYPADTEVDSVLIEKLNRYPTIICVTIKENVDLASTHYEKIRYDENFKAFELAHANVLEKYKIAMLHFVNTGKKFPDDFFLGLYDEIYETLPNGFVLLDYLYNLMPNEDELTFTQCLNSALLAGTFADWISMNQEAKNTMILAGFYYDIGKLKLPYDLLWKPGRLTDEEYTQIKQHPAIGYDLVAGITLNQHVKNVVLMHHERMDGSGYPSSLSGSQIDIFARYLAIIDTYTAMASPRAYRNAFTPLQILGVLEKSIEKYDVELLLPLMKRISDAQIGTTVLLSDNTEWEVLVMHPNKFSRPILKNKQNEILDLLDYPELEITKNI
uniref:HD-GYP domain-containing protein n=1 Tax=Acetatifactor sp. TaxID=1872090 RepID=UPI004056D925